LVERYPVRLRLTQEEAERYTPPQGINVIWIKWEKPDTVVAEFVCSEIYPEPLYRKTAQDLRHEVGTMFRNRIITDNLTNYPIRSRRAMTVYSLLQHPHVVGSGVPREVKRAAEAATEVHESEYTKEQVQYMAEKAGVKPGQIEAKEVRHRRKVFSDRTPEGEQIHSEGPLEEVHVFDMGLVDAG
jgi:hypothetical protein